MKNQPNTSTPRKMNAPANSLPPGTIVPGLRVLAKVQPVRFPLKPAPTAAVTTHTPSTRANSSVVHSNLHPSWANPTPVQSGDLAFITTKNKFGWMHCMSPHPVAWDGIPFSTTEHFFQWLRFKQYPEVQDKIRAQKSPMQAKWVAAEYGHLLNRTGSWDESLEDIELMRLVLREKVDQHPDLAKKLKATRSSRLIEDCTHRDRGSAQFWGAVRIGDQWHGENVLGCLWMQRREALA